jgi:hypothetical protein
MKFKDKSIFKNKNKRFKKNKDRMKKIIIIRLKKKIRWKRLIIKEKKKINEFKKYKKMGNIIYCRLIYLYR